MYVRVSTVNTITIDSKMRSMMKASGWVHTNRKAIAGHHFMQINTDVTSK